MRAAAVALLIGLAFGASAQPIADVPAASDQPNTQAADQPGASQQQPAAPPPIIVNVVPAPKTEAEAEQERHERAEKADLDRRLVDFTAELATFTRWLAYATIALVIATAGLAYFAFRQARDMQTSLALTRQSAQGATDSASAAREHARATWSVGSGMEAAANAAQKAAEASAASVEIAREQIRARVSIPVCVMEWDGKGDIKIRAEFKNTGLLPATKAGIHYGADLTRDEPMKLKQIAEWFTVIGPGQTLPHRGIIPNTNGELTAHLAKDDGQVFVSAVMAYWDGFEERVTRKRGLYDPAAGMFHESGSHQD